MPQRTWPARAVLALAWGLAFVLMRVVVGSFGWTAALVAGSLVTAAALLAATRLGARATGRPALRRVAILGGWVALQNLGLCLSLHQAGLGLTAVVLGSMPLFATLVGQVWGVERITAAGVLGLAIGFVGLLLVVLFPAGGHSWSFIAGVLAGLLGSFAAAVASRYADRRLPGQVEGVAGAHALAGIVALPLALVLPSTGSGSPWGWVALLGLAVLVAWAGPVLVVRDPLDGSGETSRVRAAGLVAAALFGAALLGEGLSGGQVVGTVLLLAGATLVLELLPSPLLTRGSR